MKYLFILFSISSLLGLGCRKADKLTQFNMEYHESVVIPSSTGIALPFNLFTPDIRTNSESVFSVNDTRKDLIEEIILKRLTLTLTSPPDSDFGFLKSIEIYLSAKGLDEKKVAWSAEIPAEPVSFIELETAPDNLMEYIKADTFALRLSTVTDEILTSDHHIEVYALFRVNAEILGI